MCVCLEIGSFLRLLSVLHEHYAIQGQLSEVKVIKRIILPLDEATVAPLYVRVLTACVPAGGGDGGGQIAMCEKIWAQLTVNERVCFDFEMHVSVKCTQLHEIFASK